MNKNVVSETCRFLRCCSCAASDMGGLDGRKEYRGRDSLGRDRNREREKVGSGREKTIMDIG